jgi:antitoxin ChpS
MSLVSIRRQGGAAIMTIPSEVLKALHLDLGAQLEIAITDDGFIARPLERPKRRRYCLRELLRGATPDTMRRLHDDTAWAREGAAAGREL